MRTALSIRTLRDRRLGFLGTALALLCAAAMLTACGILMQTGLFGTVPTERYAATPLVVAADQSVHFRKSDGKIKAKPDSQHAWLGADVLARLRTLPAGRGAVGELTFPATLVLPGHGPLPGPHSGSWGHGWSSAVLTPFSLATGHVPTAANQVVLDAGLAASARVGVGDAVTVETAEGRSRFQVVGVTAQHLDQQAALFFADGEAARLAGHPGEVYAIGLPHATAADAPAVRAALHGTTARVVTGAARGAVEFTGATRARSTLISVSAVLAGNALIVALLVVGSTSALTIGQRSRELALLRAIGATPRQVRRMIGAEAVLVGIVAAGAGGGLGILVAHLLRERLVAIGAMPAAMALRAGPVPVAIGALSTVLAGWFAARVAARRTVRLRPADALTETSVEPRGLGWARVLFGALTLAGFVVLLLVLTELHSDAASSPVAFAAVLLAAIAVALFGPLLARGATALLTPPMRAAAPRAGFLAAANNRTNARRLTAVITPLTLAVTITCAILFMPSSVGRAAAEQRQAGVRADAVLMAAGPGVPAEVTARAGALPGVTAVTAQVTGAVRLGQDPYPAEGLGTSDVDRNVDLGVVAGSMRDFGPGSLALSTIAADDRGLHVGERVPVTLGDGTTVTLRLVAVYGRGIGFGDVTLPFSLMAAHMDDPMASAVLVRGASPAELSVALRSEPGIRAMSPADFRRALLAADEVSTEIGYLMMGLVIVFTAIAVVNTLAMATGARSNEFGSLRLVGTTRRQVIRMVRVETCAVVGAAVGLGSLLGLAVLLAYAAGMVPGDGPYIPPAAYCAIIAAAFVLAWAAVAPTARAALRSHPLGAGRGRADTA